MGLRCLLGHDFGEAEVERDREEEGDEMVVTIREVKTCRRCGTERVISENKEVTSIRTAEEVGLDSGGETGTDAAEESAPATEESAPAADESTPAADGSAATADEPAAAAEGAVSDDPADGGPSGAVAADEASSADLDHAQSDPESDDGVILPEEDQERGHGEWPDSEVPHEGGTPTDSTAPAEADSATTAEADDTAAAADSASDAPETAGASESDEGVEVADGERDEVEILDDEDSAGDEEGGDAPGTGVDAPESGDAAEGTDSGAAWPDHEGEDVGFDAEVGDAGDVSFSGNGLTPDVDAESPGDDAEYVETDTERVEANAADRSGGRTDAGTGIAREGPASVDLSKVDAEARFYCPNCGLTRGAEESSMRAGDICPECRKGYIAERED